MTGDTIVVTWGKEYLQVTKFNGFEVGPFSVTVVVQPGETDQQAFDRGWAFISAQSDKMFRLRRDKFHEHFLLRG